MSLGSCGWATRVLGCWPYPRLVVSLRFAKLAGRGCTTHFSTPNASKEFTPVPGVHGPAPVAGATRQRPGPPARPPRDPQELPAERGRSLRRVVVLAERGLVLCSAAGDPVTCRESTLGSVCQLGSCGCGAHVRTCAPGSSCKPSSFNRSASSMRRSLSRHAWPYVYAWPRSSMRFAAR